MVVTKEHERQALKNIKDIVNELGEDSYIATAFDGVWELAEENIENDWACSCAWFKTNYYNELKKSDYLRSEFDAKERRLNEIIKEQDEELSRKESIISEQEMRIKELEVELEKIGKEKFDRGTDIRVLKDKLSFAEREIIELKAKLYDLLFKAV